MTSQDDDDDDDDDEDDYDIWIINVWLKKILLLVCSGFWIGQHLLLNQT